MLFIILTTCLSLLAALTQLFPGAFILLVGMLIWGAVMDTLNGAFAMYFTLAGLITFVFMVVKYLWAGRFMKRQGISNSSLVIGAVVGIVGFFAIPVVGLFIGFIFGVYLAEYRKDRGLAWIRTKIALKGVLLTIMLESLAILLAAGVWTVGNYQLL